jgi:subtilisin-like proprotein convertase family protein
VNADASETGLARPAAFLNNPTMITVPATGTSGVSGPYPASLVVSGFHGSIGRLAVRLNALSHTFPGDLDIVLVGPGGQSVMLMSDIGGGTPVTDIHLTFQDGAPVPPAALVSGTYAPTNVSAIDNLPLPAPAGPYSTSLAVFNGTNPNGTWSLYVFDDADADIGTLFGFTLIISGHQFDDSTLIRVPPAGTAGTTLATMPVSGITGSITKVVASFYLTHTFDGDLEISLIAPDGTTVPLVVNRGGGGDNFGTSCANRTTFDDAAAVSITAGAAPFAGTFRPEGPLSAFNGKSGAAVNGTWTLSLADEVGGDFGNLQCWSLAITVDDSGALQPPTGLRAASIVGNQVTFRWVPPPSGPAPTNYVVEGGVNPGQVLASLPTGSTYPIFTVTAPTGAFYVRVRAQAGGSLGGPSNEIRIFVNLPTTAPSPPTSFQAIANGSTLGLLWRNTFLGGTPASLVLDVSGSATASIPLGFTDRASFSGVPGGTYTLSLRAVNAAGSSSPATVAGGIGGGVGDTFTFTFPEAGCVAPPGTPIRFLGYKIGNTIYVIWEPAAYGTASIAYVLNVTGSFVGSFPTITRSLSGTVGPGTYNLSVSALNPCGVSPPTPVQVVTIP